VPHVRRAPRIRVRAAGGPEETDVSRDPHPRRDPRRDDEESVSDIVHRVQTEDGASLTEPLYSGGRYTHRAWCAIRGRHRRFSLDAAAWYAFEATRDFEERDRQRTT
jgi:hypothetical protein